MLGPCGETGMSHLLRALRQVAGVGLTRPPSLGSLKVMTKRILPLVLLVSFVMPCAVRAENLLKDGGFTIERPDQPLIVLSLGSQAEPSDQDAVLIARGDQVVSSELVEVDPERGYELSGWFKSAGPEQVAVYLGVRCFDENRVPIWSPNVAAIKGTETKLTQAASQGDEMVRIADGSGWKAHEWGRIAFNIDPQGGLSDLPNRNLSGAGISQVKKANSDWEVMVSKPLDATYPEGTPVRQHIDNLAALYFAGTFVRIPQTWTRLTGEVKGIAPAFSQTSFWPGTKFISVIIVVNPGSEQQDGVYVGGLELTSF